MRENENRTMNPSAYTTPASVFNTVAVDIDSDRNKPASTDIPALPLKTVMLPASELLKLDPIANNMHSQVFTDEDENTASKSSTFDRYNMPQDALLSHEMLSHVQPPQYPVPCEIISALTQQIQSLDSTGQIQNVCELNEQSQHFQNIAQASAGNQILYSNTFHANQQPVKYVPPSPHSNLQHKIGQCTPNRPPHSELTQKSRSLERNTPPPLVAYSARISSLERMQNAAKQSRSNSLTRQFGSGEGGVGFPPTYTLANRSASLERSASAALYNNRTKSLERANQSQLQAVQPHIDQSLSDSLRGGSLERNQSPATAYEMLKMRGFRSGSLERNNSAGMQYQIYREQFKQSANPDPEPFQEEIYDFGGANVKSCASIALNKSISKGLLPPGTPLPPQMAAHQHQQPQYKPMDSVDGKVMQPVTTSMPKSAMAAYNSQHCNNQNFIQQQQSYQNYGQPNATYTPMYPRMWTGSQQIHPSQSQHANVALSHAIFMQQTPNFAQNATSNVAPGHVPQMATATQNTPQKMNPQSGAQSKPLIASQTTMPLSISNVGGTDALGATAVQVCRLFKSMPAPLLFVSSLLSLFSFHYVCLKSCCFILMSRSKQTDLLDRDLIRG